MPATVCRYIYICKRRLRAWLAPIKNIVQKSQLILFTYLATYLAGHPAEFARRIVTRRMFLFPSSGASRCVLRLIHPNTFQSIFTVILGPIRQLFRHRLPQQAFSFKHRYCSFFPWATVTSAGRRRRSAIMYPFCSTLIMVLAFCSAGSIEIA